MSVMQNHFNVDNKNEYDKIAAGHMIDLQDHSRDELYNMLYDSLNFDVKSITKSKSDLMDHLRRTNNHDIELILDEISDSFHSEAEENGEMFCPGYQKKAACTSKRPCEFDEETIDQLPGTVVKKSLKSTSINVPEAFGKIQEPVDTVSLIPLINSSNNWQLSKFSLVHSSRKKWDDKSKTPSFLSTAEYKSEQNEHQKAITTEKTSEDSNTSKEKKKKRTTILRSFFKMKRSKPRECKIFDF